VAAWAALAACAAHGATQEENLKALRGRIDALNRELEKKEGSQREVRDALRESERAISATNRSLNRLAAEGREVRAEAARIAARRAALGIQISEKEKKIERMLVASAASGAPDALRRLDAEFENAKAAWHTALARGGAAALAGSALTLLHYCDHEVRIALLSPSAWRARYADDIQADDARLERRFEQFQARQRQFASLLDAVAGEVAPLQRSLPAADRARAGRPWRSRSRSTPRGKARHRRASCWA